MLPIPFINFIPKFFNRDDKLLALSSKSDEQLLGYKEDVLRLNTLIDPARIDSVLLDDIGQYLYAGIGFSDTDRIKRQKISNAIMSHKQASTWKWDIKPAIDILTGGDAILYSSIGSADFILLGQEVGDPDYYWGAMGADGVDLELGIDIIGDGNESVIAGIFEIDLGLGSINEYSDLAIIKTTSILEDKVTSIGENKFLLDINIDLIKQTIESKIPSYFRVFLGYTIDGNFIRYLNGQIN